jgi:hypothetical protein
LGRQVLERQVLERQVLERQLRLFVQREQQPLGLDSEL